MNESKAAEEANERSVFLRETQVFRASFSASRSAAQLRLFDYLVERSNDERAPKEIEIALAVFGDDGMKDTTPDSGVRVYVHRLRKRLDEFYFGKDGPRLIIPKGGYRLLLEWPLQGEKAGRVFFPLLGDFARSQAVRQWLVATFTILIVGVAAWYLWPESTAETISRRLQSSMFWRGLDDNVPTVVVAGDSFALAETNDQRSVKQMIIDPTIKSRDDLGQHLKMHPESFYKLYDLDLHFAPVATALAAWDLQSSLPITRSGKARKSEMLPVSALTPQILRSRDLVYVGRLSDIGPLAAPLARVTRFRITGNDKIHDVPSGKQFRAILPSNEHKMRTDYGYIASIASPGRKRLLFVSGLGDMAIKSMVELADDPGALATLQARSGNKRHFEALYELRSVDGIQVDRRLILSRALT
ncbi:MAG: helix-turn-helix domain-containing protein [Sphingobium sp.]